VKPVARNARARTVPSAVLRSNQSLLRAPFVQTKAMMSGATDPLEREADQVSHEVMRTPGRRVQRDCAACQEEEGIQRKLTGEASSRVSGVEASVLTGGGAPLSAGSRAFFEPRFERDFSGVRIHSGPSPAQLNDTLQARAFTFGNHVWLGRGESEGRTLLLAHELTHVVQQTQGLRRIARAPRNTAAPDLQAEREEMVRGAIDFIATLHRALAFDRARARQAFARAGGPAAGSRSAHPLLNQTMVRERLERGRRIYEAQRTTLDADHALQGELRSTYASFLGEVREAFDEALTLAANDQQAEREEQAAYGESLVLWLEASPLQQAAIGGRTSFTDADVAASARQETDLTTVLTTIVPHLNLVKPGMINRARVAIRGTQSRITRPAVGGAAQVTPAAGASLTSADAAVAQLDAAQQTIARAQSQLQVAASRMDLWLQAPTQPIDVADRVNELFGTRDTGYGALIRARLELMRDSLAGTGPLFVHMHRPADTATCTTASTLGQSDHPYDFEFCGNFTSLDRDAAILIHELAHAVLPGRGTRGTATGAGIPLDRAYAGERLLRGLSTEEALNNAESYWQLTAALVGIRVDSIPTDTITGCTDAAPITAALALAQSAHRRAWSWLEEVLLGLNAGRTVTGFLRDLINTHLGTPSDADLTVMLTDMRDLQQSMSLWRSGHTFGCATAGECPAGALGFDARRVFENGTFTSQRRRVTAPRFCPGFFALSVDDRARAVHAMMSLSFADSYLQRPQSAWGYARLALAIYRRDFGAPPASSLAEHEAADRPPAPPTTGRGPQP